MCVIFVVDDEHTRPEEDHIRAAFQSNDDGAGAAWRQDGMVAWRKGLDQAQMIELNQSLPVPYVLHFRIASCGGIKSELTHPFEIGTQETAGGVLEGLTANPVLFHNGHWSDWQRELKDAVYKSRLTLPTGPWSDTRAMAWMVEKFGPGMLEFIPPTNRLVYFTPAGDFPLYGDFDKSGNGWSYYRGEFLCSNTHWTYKLAKSYFQTPPASMGGKSQYPAHDHSDDDSHPAVILAPDTKLLPAVRSEEVRTLLEKPFLGSGGDVQGRDHQQNPLEEVQEGAGAADGSGMEGTVEAGGSRAEGESAAGGSSTASGRDAGANSRPLMSTADKMAVVELARRQAMEQEEARWARSLQPKTRHYGMTADQRDRQRNHELRQALADAGRRL